MTGIEEPPALLVPIERVERGRGTLYIPLATCLVLSLVISILLNIFWR